jgi:hypothetical protein
MNRLLHRRRRRLGVAALARMAPPSRTPSEAGRSYLVKGLVLLGLLVAGAAAPATPAAAVPQATPAAGVWHINGVKAHYDAFEVSADRCQYRRLALFAVQNAQRDGAGTGYQTIVSGLYLTSNLCDPNGKVGAYMAAFAQPLPAGALTFDRTLSTVRLAGRVTFSDEFTGATLPLDVDVTWSATSDPLRFSGGQGFHALRCGYTEHATGYFRAAAVTGAVTGPDGAAYLPSDPQYPDVGVEQVDDGIIDVGCPGAAAARINQAAADNAQSASPSMLTAYTVASQGALAIAGPVATAQWSRTDSDGCHRTEMYLTLSDQTVRDTGAPVEEPNVDGIGYVDDLCHPGMGADAVFVFGYGGVDVQPGGIAVDRQLGSASAHFTVEGVIETIDGFEFVPVRVDLDWTATSDPLHTNGSYRFHLAGPQQYGCGYVTTANATERDASATGTVTFGDVQAAAGTADGALLENVRQGEHGTFCW